MSRIFATAGSAVNEIARDLYEMGVTRVTETMQDKIIIGDTDFHTRELFNYSFCVVDIGSIDKVFPTFGQDISWAIEEFIERKSEEYINPGFAWKQRPEMWKQFLERNKGRFSYTYNERYRTQLPLLVTRAVEDPFSRQLILSMWDPTIDPKKLGRDRVPCSIMYHFIARRTIDNKIAFDMIYHMRSCDFVNHFINDLFLAGKLLTEFVWQVTVLASTNYVANNYFNASANEALKLLEVGDLYMNISSLHYYRKDEDKVKGIMEQWQGE